MAPTVHPDPLNAYPESLWPSRHWRASHPGRPCPVCHSPRVLGNRRPVSEVPSGLGWVQASRGRCLPCSERESRSPRFRNHWPSTFPVTEKAQQEPHMPYKRRAKSGPDPFPALGQSSHHALTSEGSNLVLDFGDSPLLPPVPLRWSRVANGQGQGHPLAPQLFQEGIQVDGVELLLCRQRWVG